MEIKEQVKQCTVRLHHQESSHDGTGFLIAPYLIVTCAHVINLAKDKTIFAYNYQQEKLDLKLIYCSDDKNKLDLAFLEIIDKNKVFNYLQLDTKIEDKDEFYSYGFPEKYPQGDPNTFEYIGQDGKELIKFKLGNVKRGASGSALLNLSTDKICGMIIKTLDNDLALGGRALSSKAILTNLSQQVPDYLLPQKSGENPFIPTSGAITNSELLFATKQIITEVFEILNAGSGVALIGETGMGKSSLLQAISKFSATLLKESRKPAILNLGDVSNDDEYYQEICNLFGISPIVKGRDFVRALKKIKQEEQGFLLLIDTTLAEEDLTYEGFTRPLRSQLRSLANDSDPPLRLVIVANKPLTEIFADSGMDSPFEGICLEIELSSWNETTIKEFIKNRLSKTPVNFTKEEIEDLIKKSQGNPRRLMQLCNRHFAKQVKN